MKFEKLTQLSVAPHTNKHRKDSRKGGVKGPKDGRKAKERRDEDMAENREDEASDVGGRQRVGSGDSRHHWWLMSSKNKK